MSGGLETRRTGPQRDTSPNTREWYRRGTKTLPREEAL